MKIKKLLSFLGISVAVFFIGLITLVLFPQPLFANNYSYDQVNIYTKAPIDQNAFNQAIDQAITLLQKSELYDADYIFDVFLADQTAYNRLDDWLMGRWPVARAVANNVIIKRRVEVEKGLVDNGENRFELVYVLAHEMIHCLQNHRFGMRKFNPLNHPPFWKLEGYPEYIARQPLLQSEEYTLKKGISDFLSLTKDIEENHQIIQIAERESTPYIYYKGRLMMEYLIDIKGMSYAKILEEEVKEDAVFKEMMAWYNEQ